MSLDTTLAQVIGLSSNRRGLLRGAGISAATLSAIAMGMPTDARAQEAAAAITDADILNFALNLEYLEAEFYQRAVYGAGLPTSLTTGANGAPGGTVTGGSQVTFTTPLVREFAEEVAQDELLHVQFLRKELGSAAIAEPDIDLGNSFAVLGMAAGIKGTFSPYASENDFLLGGYIFEDVGVTAYHGAATLITSKAYLAAAAGILAVEAYHASEFRVQILQNGLSSDANKISALRGELSVAGGSKHRDDQGTRQGARAAANVVPTDRNSIAFARTPDEVLNIVYGGGSASNYLFFPNKVNGTIQ
jgi:hypothetical protein